MKTKRITSAWVAVLCSLVLVGGAAAFVSSPASAKAGISWGKIWKHQLQPKADKRYYKKSQSDAKYAAAGSSYSKAESDGKYAGAGSSYSKAQSDAKYSPYPTVIRGVFSAIGFASVAGNTLSDNITFGQTLASVPTVHYINSGAVLPPGCSGTPAAPSAAPGNLCVFEQLNNNGNTRGIFSPTGVPGVGGAFGAIVAVTSAAAGQVFVYGSWAVGVAPGAVAANKHVTSPLRGSGPMLGQ